MNYRSLLVWLDADPACDARVRVAVRLAVDLGCHLVGVAPTGRVELPASAGAATALADAAQLAIDVQRRRAERTAARFREACAAAGLESFDAIVAGPDAARELVRHAHCSDLTIVTQPDPHAAGAAAHRALVEQVLLHGARPTLLLAHDGRAEPLGRRILVAWDDSREAARALADALPLLRRAERVQVVGWDEAGRDDALLAPRIAALRPWLARHGVVADVRVEPRCRGRGVADAMRAHAAALGADLIVMGAYGHSRWAERVLGGATHAATHAMTVPLLLSH